MTVVRLGFRQTLLSRFYIFALSLVFTSGVPATTHAQGDEQPPTEKELFTLPSYLTQIIDERIRPIRIKEARLMALLQLLYDADKLNMQYANDITRTPMQALAARQGNCVSLSFTFAAMARHADLKVYFMESTDPGRWKQVGEHYALERHMSLYLPIRTQTTKGYHVDFQYAEPEHLRHKKMSDTRAIADYYNNRAVENLMVNRLDLALAYAQKTVTADPDYDAGWLNYGLIQRHIGNPEAAIKAYQTALKHNSNNLSAYNNLVVVYKQQNELEKADKLMKKVRAHQMRNPFYLHNYGEYLVRDNQLEQAINYFKQAIKRDKNIPAFYMSLAEAYYLNGDVNAALEVLEKGMDKTFDSDFKSRLYYTFEYLKAEQEGLRVGKS